MPSAGPVTNWGYARSANEALVNGTVRTNAALNVGGRTITMPAAMRFASNAPRFAAAVLFSNPYLRAGMAAAAWLGAAKVIWDESSKTWKTEVLEEISPYKYKIYGSETVYESAQEACNTFFANNQYRTTVTPIQKQANGSYFGCSIAYQVEGITYWYPIQNINPFLACPTSLQNGKCLIANTSPLTKDDFEKQLSPEVWRPTSPGIVPQNWPDVVPAGTPLPVEVPVINPAPGPLPETPAAPRPYFVPSGDPVPNPNYNPNAEPSPTNQPFIIPGTRIVPSPTPSEPWRVDVQPVQRPTDSEVPKSAEELNPNTNPNPDQQPKDNPKPEEQQQLCEKYPDILACQKLDTPEAQDLAKEEVQISIMPLGGWGSEDAACPAPKTANVMGREVAISWQPVCDFAGGLRPLVIAMAWLSAASMLVVVARRGN